ncbi:hypothetical protein [Aureispira anguillae]|uniref:Uncharacterized protein n=1 Tax=Aureispira anguillae TaxID=2864201 RepID=A0A915YEL7_9BACT|nr:hypothetical protein [Aureispira anguillae]BDS11708.1 hypothetical protein AsAng_0024220 [Aureispira anguillae]
MNSLKHLKNLSIGCLMLLLFCAASYRIIPVVSLNGMTNGPIEVNNFIRNTHLEITCPRSRDCAIHTYTMYHISLTKELQIIKGKQCAFSPSIQAAIKQAEKGDKYIFIGVKVRCEGDVKSISVNPLNFNIK